MSNTLIKSPLRYPGGKQKLVKQLFNKFPSEFSEYREPFFGGGSVFFFLKQQDINAKINNWWINDKFKPVANFWQQNAISSENVTNSVKRLMNDYPVGKELHSKLRKDYSEFLNEEEQAAALFILNRCSFSGLTFSGGYSQQAFDGRLTTNSIKNISKIENLFSKTKITNLDYSDLLSTPAEKDNKVFIFMDPPYDIKSSTLYGKTGNMHQNFNHEEFAENCKNCKDHLWMITYNDNEYIKNLFSWANIQEIEVIYNMNSAGKRKKELVITNY